MTGKSYPKTDIGKMQKKTIHFGCKLGRMMARSASTYPGFIAAHRLQPEDAQNDSEAYIHALMQTPATLPALRGQKWQLWQSDRNAQALSGRRIRSLINPEVHSLMRHLSDEAAELHTSLSMMLERAEDDEAISDEEFSSVLLELTDFLYVLNAIYLVWPVRSEGSLMDLIERLADQKLANTHKYGAE